MPVIMSSLEEELFAGGPGWILKLFETIESALEKELDLKDSMDLPEDYPATNRVELVTDA